MDRVNCMYYYRLLSRHLLCCVVSLLILAHGSVSHAQKSAHCRKKLQKKDFQGAAACFQILSRQYPKKLSFLRNQGIIYRMWSTQQKTKNLTQSCRLMSKAIAIFEQYSKRAKGVDKLEMVARITKLKSQRKLVNLSITTTPEHASLLIVGYKFKKKAKAPQLLTGLCPGTYHMRIEASKHFPRQTTLKLKPGETVARNYVLRSRIKPRRRPPTARIACPMRIANLFGPAGCRYWRACNKQKGKACEWISLRFRERGDFRRTMTYSSMACELKHHPACERAGLMHLSENRRKIAKGYFEKGCKAGLADACQKLGDFYAGRYPNWRGKKRQCTKAIRTYHRACQLGREASCRATCNTINVTIPVLVNVGLHVGSLTAGALLGPNGQGSAAGIFIAGGLSLILETIYIPLWLAAFRRHQIALPITATVTIALPITAAVALYAGSLSITSTTPGDSVGTILGFIASGLLLIVTPIHILWAIYTWLTYKRHEDTIADMKPKPKISWMVTPTILPQGAGFALTGSF